MTRFVARLLLLGLLWIGAACNLIMGMEAGELAPSDATTAGTTSTGAGGNGGGAGGAGGGDPSCSDGEKNGAETGTDCGGMPESGCPTCSDGGGCVDDADCASAHCGAAQTCCTPSDPVELCEGKCGLVADACGEEIECSLECVGEATCGGGESSNVCGCAVDPCTVWSVAFGDAANQVVSDVAMDGAGNIVAVGRFQGSVDFGGHVLTSAGGEDLFVVKLDSSGGLLWAKRFGGADSQDPRAVALDGAGNIIITGTFGGTIDFGGGSLVATVQLKDMFVAKLDPSGAHLFSKRFGNYLSGGTAIAIDGAGNVHITGYFLGDIDFGGATFSTYDTENDTDVFVVKFGPTRTHVWSKQFGRQVAAEATGGVGVDGLGDVYVSMSTGNGVDLGGGPLAAASSGVAIVKLASAAGSHIWSQLFASDVADGTLASSDDMGVTALGDHCLTGRLSGRLVVAQDTLESAGNDVTLLCFAADGVPALARNFGSADDQFGISIAIDSLGDIHIAGRFRGTLAFGEETITAAGLNDDGFLARLGRDGVSIWARALGDAAGAQQIVGIATNEDRVVVVGNFTSSVATGADEHVTAGGTDVFVASFDKSSR